MHEEKGKMFANECLPVRSIEATQVKQKVVQIKILTGLVIYFRKKYRNVSYHSLKFVKFHFLFLFYSPADEIKHSIKTSM